MQGNRHAWVLALGGLVPLLAGCFDPPPEAQARLEAVRRQGEALDEAMDRIEERMLGTRATVSLWQEMAWRHQRVSAVACENAASHVVAMERHLQSQDQKSRRLTRQRRFEANAPVSATTSTQGRKSRSN